MKTRQLYLSALAAGTLAMAATPLFAASSPSVGLSITASVAAKCIVSSTSAVAFGAYDPVVTNAAGGADLDGTGTVGIKCSPGNGSSISLDSGANASGNQRRMQGPAGTSSAFLNYDLYSDAARTTAWGNGSNGASALTITASSNASERPFTVYGRVPKGQDVNVGSFSDTVQVTVNF
ncbi:MAG TPA: spore coat U domain-containing protein [Candidatus Udaeobacter sp.]|jgi:spore coat protein U-like protein|nr:spore coat U domain-containing protein [Candidatus Udaeobacter sp.]